MIKFSILIFLHFCIQQVFPGYLAKFQSITNVRTHGFWTFISENLRPPLISLVRTHGFWTFISENLRPPLISLVPRGDVAAVVRSYMSGSIPLE